ncbi:hypothetical protein BC827DRAFT_1211175 [Russula dissimulans]|nr:hypothetical protein BC827DRAFT_1211175 [Russula dissimulans]
METEMGVSRAVLLPWYTVILSSSLPPRHRHHDGMSMAEAVQVSAASRSHQIRSEKGAIMPPTTFTGSLFRPSTRRNKGSFPTLFPLRSPMFPGRTTPHHFVSIPSHGLALIGGASTYHSLDRLRLKIDRSFFFGSSQFVRGSRPHPVIRPISPCLF